MKRRGETPDIAMDDAAAKQTCSFCRKKKADYTCPRCASGYCSLNCYKDPRHSECSESFYKEWCEEGMQMAPASADKVAFMRRLKSLREADLLASEHLDSDDDEDGSGESEEEAEESLENRLAGVDLDDSDKVWASLSDAEKAEFRSLLMSGDEMEKLMPGWEPWWMKACPKRLVAEITEESKEPSYVDICPPVINAPPLSTLIKKEPSPLVAYSVINVLYAYVVTTKYLVGDLCTDPLASVEILVQLSAAFFKGTVFESLDAAIANVEEKAKDLRIDVDDPVSDLCAIVHGSEMGTVHFMKSALSDVHAVIVSSLGGSKKTSEGSRNSFARDIQAVSGGTSTGLPEPLRRTTLKTLAKKIEFYVAWLEACGEKSKELREIFECVEDEIKLPSS